VSLAGEVICEPPNNRLHKFRGRLDWNEKGYSLDNDKIALRVSHLAQLVLESTYLSNWIWGVGGGAKLKSHPRSCCYGVVSVSLFPWQWVGWFRSIWQVRVIIRLPCLSIHSSKKRLLGSPVILFSIGFEGLCTEKMNAVSSSMLDGSN